MAYSKQTWDTTSYVNPTRMNHIEQGIYDTDLRISRLFKTFEINLQGTTITSYWGVIPTNIDTSIYKPISILEGAQWDESLNYSLENDGSRIHIKSRVENYTIPQNRKVYVVCIVL